METATVEETVRETERANAIGMIKDATGHVKFALVMMGKIYDHLVELDAQGHEDLCDNLMFTAGMDSAIGMLKDNCLPFLGNAIMELEGGAA